MRNLSLILIILLYWGCQPDNKTKPNHKEAIDSIALRQKWLDLVKHKTIKIIDTKYNLNIGDTFNLLSHLDITGGSRWAFILDTYGLSPTKEINLKTNSIYLLDDTAQMFAIKRDWNAIYKHGDCCTPDMNLSVYRNDTVVFTTGILITYNHEDFQNRLFGWTPIATKNNIKSHLNRFRFMFDKKALEDR